MRLQTHAVKMAIIGTVFVAQDIGVWSIENF